MTRYDDDDDCDHLQIVVGVLLWNLPGKITVAKRVIQNKTVAKAPSDVEKKISVAY